MAPDARIWATSSGPPPDGCRMRSRIQLDEALLIGYSIGTLLVAVDRRLCREACARATSALVGSAQ